MILILILLLLIPLIVDFVGNSVLPSERGDINLERFIKTLSPLSISLGLNKPN